MWCSQRTNRIKTEHPCDWNSPFLPFCDSYYIAPECSLAGLLITLSVFTGTPPPMSTKRPNLRFGNIIPHWGNNCRRQCYNRQYFQGSRSCDRLAASANAHSPRPASPVQQSAPPHQQIRSTVLSSWLFRYSAKQDGVFLLVEMNRRRQRTRTEHLEIIAVKTRSSSTGLPSPLSDLAAKEYET